MHKKLATIITRRDQNFNFGEHVEIRGFSKQLNSYFIRRQGSRAETKVICSDYVWLNDRWQDVEKMQKRLDWLNEGF